MVQPAGNPPGGNGGPATTVQQVEQLAGWLVEASVGLLVVELVVGRLEQHHRTLSWQPCHGLAMFSVQFASDS